MSKHREADGESDLDDVVEALQRVIALAETHLQNYEGE